LLRALFNADIINGGIVMGIIADFDITADDVIRQVHAVIDSAIIIDAVIVNAIVINDGSVSDAQRLLIIIETV
jgi:hypothetical protein